MPAPAQPPSPPSRLLACNLASLLHHTRTLACFRTPDAVAFVSPCNTAMAQAPAPHTCRWLQCFTAPSLHTSAHTQLHPHTRPLPYFRPPAGAWKPQQSPLFVPVADEK